METGSLKGIPIYDFIKEHSEDVIVFGYGGTDLSTGKGYYKFALVYKFHLKMVEGDADGSSNRCILQGILAAAQKINRPNNVYVITSTALGFKKAVQKKVSRGPNADLCVAIVDCLELEKGCNLTTYYIEGAGDEIRDLINNSNMYFKII